MGRATMRLLPVWIGSYVVLSVVSGGWVRPLIVFPAFGLYWLFLLRQVQRRRRTRSEPPTGGHS